MRGLKRNNRLIYYANRTAEVENIDEYGNKTGELTPVYGAATSLMCNISASNGEDAVQAFGNFTGYSRTLYVPNNDCPIDEDTIIWFGVPTLDAHNYIVVRRADSKNGVLFALQEVTVS